VTIVPFGDKSDAGASGFDDGDPFLLARQEHRDRCLAEVHVRSSRGFELKDDTSDSSPSLWRFEARHNDVVASSFVPVEFCSWIVVYPFRDAVEILCRHHGKIDGDSSRM